MKKRVYLCSLFLLLLCVLGIVLTKQNKSRLIIEENTMCLELKADNRLITIKAWFIEEQETYYFFCPSFMQEDGIVIDYAGQGKVLINGESKKTFNWDENVPCKIETGDKSYDIIFMKAQNIPALFMDTDSGNMEYVHEKKYNEESGTLTIITQEGNIQYNGKLEKISGRGNSTWHPYKKPYSIKLERKHPLCGMDTGKEWKLLALYFEQSKINTKIIFDMAQKLGLTATPECRWVDLYCNGEYRGLYLLTEAVENDASAQGVYLIEKMIEDRIEEKSNYFWTEKCQYIFGVKFPTFLSDDEIENMNLLVQKIEDLLLDGDVRYRDYIDMDSLACQFLIDKIVMESDAMWASTFYDVDLQNNVLQAGPLWDYDRAMGERYSDYETPVEGEPNAMREWYMQLYKDDQFFGEMMAAYREIMPYIQALLDYQIDEYADMISHSVAMDSVLMEEYSWVNETCSYTEYGSYIKYLKFFLASRMNYLNSIWEINDVTYDIPPSSGEWHEVKFLDESGELLDVIQVLDGETIEEFPESDLSGETDWYWWHGECGQKYDSKMPIYENTALALWSWNNMENT